LLSSHAVKAHMSVLKIRPFARPLLCGLILSIVQTNGTRASEASTFSIAAAGGYGIEDCLGEGGECGKVVADAWCEAHGRGAALSFGRTEIDYDVNSERANPARYLITCGD
jgi:hypothetical protein